MRPITRIAVLPFAGLLGCGSPASQNQPAVATAPAISPATSPSAAPPPAEASSDSPATGDSSAHLPSSCEGGSADPCVPPRKFVDRLCTKPHQDVALALFGKTSPFTRLYMKARVDELLFDEEVLALRRHVPPKGGMVVGSGNGTYDVLRWDGSCSMGVEAEMLTRARPPHPRVARVQWHRVGDRTQSALIAASEQVKRAHAKRGKECKGAMSGDVSAACEKADSALVDAIVDYVRGGGELPELETP